MESPTVAAAAAGATLLLLLHRRRQRQAPAPQLPPGPTGLPLIGILHKLNRDHSHEQISQLQQVYGPVFSYRMGTQLFIAVCEYQLLKELLEDPRFTGRPQSSAFQRHTQGCGILFSEGTSWSQQRRLALRTLRDFGFATKRSAELVAEQVDVIFESLDASCESGEPVPMLEHLTEATNSVIATLTLGVRFRRGDAEFDAGQLLMRRLFAGSSALRNLTFLFPFLEPLMRWLPTKDPSTATNDAIHEYVLQLIQRRHEQIKGQESFEPECLYDVYIQERRKAEALGDFETFKDMQIIRVVLELFFAGTDTTARSLEWLLIHMAYHPDVQRRVQEELDSVVGRGRRPELADRQQLAYTCAVIEESLRLVALAPLGLFHRARSDTTFHGFRIPADALIVPLVYSVSRDESLWPQAEEFRPERFLDDVGGFSGAGKSVPFLIGRRACVGESLARMEIFLIFSSLMQRYCVGVTQEAVGKRRQILRGRVGILRIPGDCPLVFKFRG